MKPDDELCLCFHVSWRKVINYIRIHQVKTPSLLHACGGAGTGCGWCRKQLEKLTTQVGECPPDASSIEAWLQDRSPDKSVYAAGREKYREHQANSEPTGLDHAE
ncbi:MAG: (2Fe-2S)-binding protein [Pirellula sp.]